MTQAEAAVAKETPAHVQKTNKPSCIAAVSVADASLRTAVIGLLPLRSFARFHRGATYSAIRLLGLDASFTPVAKFEITVPWPRPARQTLKNYCETELQRLRNPTSE